jgi:hypothetical protein
MGLSGPEGPESIVEVHRFAVFAAQNQDYMD